MIYKILWPVPKSQTENAAIPLLLFLKPSSNSHFFLHANYGLNFPCPTRPPFLNASNSQHLSITLLVNGHSDPEPTTSTPTRKAPCTAGTKTHPQP